MNNENYQVVAKIHAGLDAGGNGNLTINFAWPYNSYLVIIIRYYCASEEFLK